MTSPGVDREVVALPYGASMTVLRGDQPGPTVAVLGGVHGDEDEGVLAVRRLVHELSRAGLRGTVRTLAPASPAAWAARARISPLDDGNLARSFPGQSGGAPTEALAAAITERVIAGADLLIDLHSAGADYRMPLFCGFALDGAASHQSARAARAFGAPLIWAHPATAPGRTLSAADECGIPAIYAECSGGGSIRAHELTAYVRGVISVFADLDMVASPFPRSADEARWVFGPGDLDEGAQAARPGWFVTSTVAGALVDAGDEIGWFYDYEGNLLHEVRAPRQGVVMFLRRRARTKPADVLYVLADVKDPRE